MSRKYDFDRNFEAKQSRRMKAEDRYLTKIENMERKIDQNCMVGHLIRDGRKVYYFWNSSMKKPFESFLESEVNDFIMKHHYAR